MSSMSYFIIESAQYNEIYSKKHFLWVYSLAKAAAMGGPVVVLLLNVKYFS